VQMTLITNNQPAVVVHPPEAPLHFPPASVRGSHLDGTASLGFDALAPLESRDSRLDTPLSQLLAKLFAVISFICYQLLWSGLGSASLTRWRGHSNALQGGICQLQFVRLSRVYMQADGQPVPIYHNHHLGAFAHLGLAYSRPPFLAGTKLPSKNACAHSILLWASNLLNRVRHIFSQVCSSLLDHSCKRRQQVVEEPYSPGISAQAQPVLSTYSIPLRVRRSSARGLPLLDCFFGTSGSITAHCASVSSCRLVMLQV